MDAISFKIKSFPSCFPVKIEVFSYYKQGVNPYF